MQPVKRGDVPRLIGRTKGGLNSKLHAVCDGEGRPVRLLLTEGQQSDHKGAATLLADLPSATEMLGDKGYDSDAYRAALVKRGITPCIPPRAKRKNPATYCKALYKQRHKVENMFAKLKDWRRIAMRYDRCAHVFLSAIQIATVVIFWINQCVLTLKVIIRRSKSTCSHFSSRIAVFLWAVSIANVINRPTLDILLLIALPGPCQTKAEQNCRNCLISA